MPTTYLVKEISTITGSSPATIRSWCATFAEFLSATATPPEGQQRVFTEKDLAIFQRIADLRSTEKIGNDAIKERLRTEDITQLQPYIDLATAPSSPPQQPVTIAAPPTNAQESQQQPQAMIELYTAVISHQSAITARIDALQQQIDSQARDSKSRLSLLALGFVAGLLVAGILIGAAWLMK